MTSITGTSAHNITAVGTGEIDMGGTKIVLKSVAFHFNGTSWSNMTIPAKVDAGPGACVLRQEPVVSERHRRRRALQRLDVDKTKLPIVTAEPNLNMTSISGSSPSDIWAAGTAFQRGLHRDNSPILEHFNGTSWTNVTVPGGKPTGGITDVRGHHAH